MKLCEKMGWTSEYVDADERASFFENAQHRLPQLGVSDPYNDLYTDSEGLAGDASLAPKPA